jgi:uncharacterized protein (DUF1501 family)
MNNINRREFIKIVGGTVSMAAMPEGLLADDSFNDFKALVVVDLMGGSDGFNMFIPSDATAGSKTGYDMYAKARAKTIRIEAKDFMSELRKKVGNSGYLEFAGEHDMPYYAGRNMPNTYLQGFYLHQNNGFDSKIATNIVMPELAYWLDRGKGAVVQNVGNLILPATKSEIKQDKSKRPPFLFGHDQQATLKSIGSASSITKPTGWLGLLADKWLYKYNGPTPHNIYSMDVNMSPFGNNKSLFGNTTTGMNYNNRGPIAFENGYINRDFDKQWFGKEVPDMFEKLYADIRLRVLNDENKLVSDWKSITGENDTFASVKDCYGYNVGAVNESLDRNMIGFAQVPWNYINDFMTAARLIKIAKDNGLKRQVIYLSIGGWDSHSNMQYTHALSLRGLSLAIDKFMRAMSSKGLLDSVALMSVSEFGRSLGSNSGGTDHAWGSSYFVLGGGVKPGNYGKFMDLTLDGDDDYGGKGRFVPTTSFSQYYATVLKWFGATDSEIEYALPEIKNFPIRDLGFMKRS